MEIIERGRIPEEKQAFGTCFHCKTRVKVKAEEGKYENDQRDGDFRRFKCPVCGDDICIAVKAFE